MNISTRLILLLTASVSVVMLAASLLTLRQRETVLHESARAEMRAHAFTLRIALEEDYRAGRALDAQRLISRLRENVGVYSVILFDQAGNVTHLSNTITPDEFRFLAEARQAIARGVVSENERSIGGEVYFSIVMPLSVDTERVGAIEIVQPISFVNAHIARARWDIALTALLLCLTILLVVAIVTRYNLARPIQELLGGAAAVGQGDLNYRVIVPAGGSELARLAREFNRMADSLAEQRRVAARDAEERIALERKLRHSERLAAVGRLAAGVAHEMGAPLQVIDGRAKQLLDRHDAPIETRQRNLTIIRTQAERITRIVRNLLDLSRPYNLRRQPVELTQLVNSAIELIEIQAESANIHIQVLPGADAVVEADSELMHQVLLNIFRNALQAMPNGGQLRVECLADGARKDGRRFAAMQIADTGNGIAPDHLPRIFDPFFTTKEVGHGTGLGLAVSNRIVEEHGGWIDAANASGGGALFTVYLPAAVASATSENHFAGKARI